MIKVGINGWGRIATCVMRAIRQFDDMEVVGRGENLLEAGSHYLVIVTNGNAYHCLPSGTAQVYAMILI